ncbi:MAG: T9SS type B sorting domain-containing protein [Algibacter sp.]|uniref:Ig-like domain-containing protein n=1 Tax=Algibacter sp. TaxID=1872428 RepID=UPI00329A5315
MILASICSSAQNIAPTLTALGNQPYCPLSQINIVTDFDIKDPDDSEIDALFVQISTGYVIGEDTLTLSNSHPNISTTWNAVEGKLTLSSNSTSALSYVDLIAAIKDVIFQSTSNVPSDKSFSITIGTANFLPSTRHYYEYVSSVGITWTDAKAAADIRTYFGLQGYLATITSAEEAQLSGEQASGAGWIGGSDAETEGVWKWVTGPEAGTIFWNGGINGSTPNFANWNNNEPNNWNNNEDYAHVTAPGIGIAGSWNDLSNTGNASGNYQPKGYIMEYGGLPGDPVLNISASTRIYTASITNTIPAARCGSGSVILEASANSGTILWFDSVTSTTSIANGNTFVTPILNSTTTYYALASINGCVEGARTPVVATIRDIPTINSVTNTEICNLGSVTLSANASSGTINWYDALSGGTLIASGTTFTTPIVNATTTYYVDATLNGCTSSVRTPITLTVQKTEAPSGDADQYFCDVNQATIADILITGTNVLWYDTSSGGNPLNSADFLEHNKSYYASQIENGCESTERFGVDIHIYETVVALQPSSIPVLSECDTTTDGNDTNGFTTFNLTLNESVLLNGKSSSDFSFNYYTDVAYSSPIITPPSAFVNTIQDNQTIYVRITNNLDSTCYTDVFFDVKVNSLPNIQTNMVLKNCDEDGVTDGYTDFNLLEVNEIITYNNASNFIITYYESFPEAELGANQVDSIFNNQTASTIYVRVEKEDGCFRIATIDLQVSTTSFSSGYFEELELCDNDNIADGLHSFDLTKASNLFISQFPLGQNLSVSYYRNQADALIEQNEIVASNYISETPFSQEIYVRVESDDNGDCFAVGPHLLLTVHPRPEFEIDQTAIYCLDNNPITLQTYNPNGNFTYEWTDENGLNVSSQPSATILLGGVYTVIARSSFGCESDPVTFDVVESAIASIDITDVTIVELAGNNSISINNGNNNLGIGDYEFSLDDINGSYQESPYFDRVGAGVHIIYVKDKNKCGIAHIEVFILGFPKFFTPNNDGENDTWRINGLGNDYTNASKVSIYNRYGKLIRQLNAKNGSWDGTFNGQPLGVSDYWFIAELIDLTGSVKTYRGHFSLVR